MYTTVTGPFIVGEIVRVGNYDGRGGTGTWVIKGEHAKVKGSFYAVFSLVPKLERSK